MTHNSRLILLPFIFVLLSSCAQYSQNNAGVTSMDVQKQIPANSEKVAEALELFRKAQYAEASLLLAGLVEEVPGDETVSFKYAETLRLTGEIEKAISLYDRLSTSGNTTTRLAAIEGKGLAYMQSGNFTGAIEMFDMVINEDINRWRTINALGVAYSLQGQKKEAMNYFKMAMAIDENNVSIANNIALSMALDGEVKSGIRVIKEAIAVASERERGKLAMLENNLAMLHGLAGDMETAEIILSRNMPKHHVYNNLGLYARLAAEKDLARTYFSKAVSQSPVFYERAWNNMQELGDHSR